MKLFRPLIKTPAKRLRKSYITFTEGSQKFQEVYRKSVDRPEEFWDEQAKKIDWFKPYKTILDRSNPPFYSWFKDGWMNACYNAVDRHVEAGRGNNIAIIYDSPVKNTKRKISYNELKSEIELLAGVLHKKGVRKGDRVVIYMPMIPQTTVAMLACARLGAIHSVVFGGFAPQELATRIDDAKPRVVLSASCGIEPNSIINYKEYLDKAIEQCKHKPDACIIYKRDVKNAKEYKMEKGRDFDWETEMSNVKPFTECVPVLGSDPLYIIYTSGTTGIVFTKNGNSLKGKPKGVVRDNAGHAVALNWSMKNIFDIEQDEVWWAASDFGWVVGHSYICYGPLIYGCTSVLFEGKPIGTPDAGVYWRIIEEHNVASMFTAPTALRAIKKEDPNGSLQYKYDLSGFKRLFVAGERCDVDTISWARRILNKQICDNYWQTETGWPIVAPCMGINPRTRIIPGSANKPVPGYDIHVFAEYAHEEVSYNKEKFYLAPRGVLGNLVIKLPLPPGCLTTIYNDDERYIQSYMKQFPGYYKTGDAGYIDDDGNVFIMSRTDDIINVAAHRLSTSAMEDVLSSHHAIAESAVVGLKDPIKGEVPLGFVVLKSGQSITPEQIKKDCMKLVREKIGAVASYRNTVILKRLPKTRSGKILRAVLRNMVNGEAVTIPPTIDDPDAITEALEELKKENLIHM